VCVITRLTRSHAQQNEFWVVMEFIDGCTLEALLDLVRRECV
jgi:hypothetical protein